MEGGDREADLQLLGTGAVGAGLGALEEAAVDQQRAPVGEDQLVAGAGDAVDGAVVVDLHWHVPC
ncbi:MAG: hypothetical protein K9L65_09900 [Chromatiaceae bacterium]|nr:hypothetical protein [Chromatiaceae bacterium]